jgi:NADH:ubiquinone oxidoreductase subunit 2 (subunit N)
VVINTAISLYYYTRVIREMYLRGFETAGGALRAPAFGKVALHVCAVVILLTGTLLIGSVRRGTERIVRPGLSAPAAVSAAAPDVAAREK